MAGYTNLNSRLARLETLNGLNDDGPPPVFAFHEWAEGAPRAFKSEAEMDAEYPRLESLALDRLVAAGEIREGDRERVTFIVRTLVESPHKE